MSDTETLKFRHKEKHGFTSSTDISVTIHADYGRWGEARSLRNGIKKVLKGEAEIVENDD